MSLYENNNNIQVLIITDDNIVSATYPFGPGGLRAPPVVADRSEAGHCFHLLFWPSWLACATRGGVCNAYI